MGRIRKFILKDFGRNNQILRDKWIEYCLKSLPKGLRILDVGAGEMPYKKFCDHLDYYSQDFCAYNGIGDKKGLHSTTFDTSMINIISDITNIPIDDAYFDVIMCTEVLEHIPNPINAFIEFTRILKPGGYLILTAPFCSLTHYSPYHYYTGFNKYFYELLLRNDFRIIEVRSYGNYFEYLAQEIYRVHTIAKKYSNIKINIIDKLVQLLTIFFLKRYNRSNNTSDELLCYGYFVFAQKLNFGKK